MLNDIRKLTMISRAAPALKESFSGELGVRSQPIAVPAANPGAFLFTIIVEPLVIITALCPFRATGENQPSRAC